MALRIDYVKAFPEMREATSALAKATHKAGIEPALLNLVFMRASQINGCAFCLNMHSQEALKLGERPVRLYILDAWRETDLYTDRERAALALTEAMTLIWKDQVPDDVYRAAAAQFKDKELAALMLAIVQINVYNQLSITAQRPPVLEAAASHAGSPLMKEA